MHSSTIGTFAPSKVWLCIAFLTSGAACLSSAVAESADPPSDHVLFIGLDLSLDRNDSVCPIIDADNGSVRIVENGDPVRVPMRNLHFKTAMKPKVSRSSLNIGEVKTDRVYSRATDPAMDAAAQQMILMTQQEEAEQIAQGQLQGAISAAEGITRAQNLGQRVDPAAVDAARAGVDNATRGVANIYNASAQKYIIPDSQTALGKAADGYDAFTVSFRIAAPEPVENAYAVLRLLARDPNNPRTPVSAIKFFNLRKIDRTPRKYTLFQAGLPKGYLLDKYEVHVYSDGRELASNLSSNRVDLNADEAYQYLLADRLANDSTSNVPIRVATELLPPDFRRRITAAQRNRSVDVAVDADGKILSLVLQSPTAPGPDDPFIESAVREVRFFPAMVDGKPIKSKTTLFLSDFVQ